MSAKEGKISTFKYKMLIATVNSARNHIETPTETNSIIIGYLALDFHPYLRRVSRHEMNVNPAVIGATMLETTFRKSKFN
jgi:hypothetical protein